jgi:hypothetical protein
MASLNPIDDFSHLNSRSRLLLMRLVRRCRSPPPRKDRCYIRTDGELKTFSKFQLFVVGAAHHIVDVWVSVESQHLDLVTGCVNSLVKTVLAINIVNLRKKNVMSILCDECAPNKLGLTPHYPGVWIYPTIPTIHISPVPWQLRPIHRLTPLQHAYAERLDLPICVQLSLPVRHNELSP